MSWCACSLVHANAHANRAPTSVARRAPESDALGRSGSACCWAAFHPYRACLKLAYLDGISRPALRSPSAYC
jgi:hypothetical protein